MRFREETTNDVAPLGDEDAAGAEQVRIRNVPIVLEAWIVNAGHVHNAHVASIRQ
jgi:hypothetical protein